MTVPENREFLTRFMASTGRRLERAQHALGSPETTDGRAMAMEIHRISGEAAMLDLPEIAQLARDAESAAHKLGVQDSTEARVACTAALRSLCEGLETEKRRWMEQAESERLMASSPRRVLVVDHSPFAARALSHVFEGNGFEVKTATSMDEVVELCGSFQPSILVTDVQLASMDVSDLCEGFRAASQGRRTGIVLVSARSDAQLQNCLNSTGADDFVPKCAGTLAVVNRVVALFEDLTS